MKIQHKSKMEKDFGHCSREYRKKVLSDDLEKMTTIHMKNYTENSVKDPAPHVQGTLEWNFNRGSLGLLETKNDQSFLVNVHDEKTMRLFEVSPEMPFKVARSRQPKDRFANEVMVGGDKFIGFRTKNSIKVANLSKIKELEDDDEFEACDIYDYSHVDEIIASSFYKDQLMVMDSNDNLVKYDLNYKAANFRFQFPPNTTNFLCRQPFSLHAVYEPGVHGTPMKFTYTTAQEFGFIDCRKSVVNKITNIPFDKHFMMTCEKIFNHSHSLMNENLTYIVTSHMLYCIDHRHFKEPLVQWTHQISEQPMMLTSTLYNNNEVVCVASNVPGDLKVFNFDGSAFNYLPYKPLGIQNSFNKLREEGHFLLADDIKERVSLSTTGIALRAEEKSLRLQLFTQNAAGDIFQGILGCHKYALGQREEDLHEHFREWDNFIAKKDTANVFVSVDERLAREELVIDDIMRMDGLAKVLACEKLQSADDEFEPMMTEKQPEWKISIEKAHNYQDILAREILNIWDDIEIADVKPSFLAEALDQADQKSEASSERISKWLRAANDTSVVIEEIFYSENVELPGTSSTQVEKIITENGTEFTIVNIEEKKMKKVTSKKKKPRLAGF